MQISRQRIGGLLAALAVLITPLAATTVMTAAPASAATCSGHGCDNTDPHNTGCSNGAYVVKQGYTTDYGDLLQLWWSPTCQTNWAQVDSGGFPTYLWTQTQDGRQTAHYFFTFNGWAWSNQLYAPTTNARACEQAKVPPTYRLGPVDCIGQY